MRIRRIASLFLVLALVMACSTGCSGSKKEKYEAAIQDYEKGDYVKSLAVFETLGDYEDTVAYRISCVQHQLAGVWVTASVAEGNYSGSGTAVVLDEAKEAFIRDLRSANMAVYLIYEGKSLGSPINTGTYNFTNGTKIYIKYDNGNSANWDLSIDDGVVTLYLDDDPLIKM